MSHNPYIYGELRPRTVIPNCYPPATAQTGQVWFDSARQSIVIFDGSHWIEWTHDVMSDIDQDSADAIAWAYDRNRREINILEMADKYPLVAEALGQLEVALKLCRNLNDDETGDQ